MIATLIENFRSKVCPGAASRSFKYALLQGVYAAAVLCSAVLGTATASEVMPYEEYAKRVDSAKTISALTSGLFGESVNLYNGATTFSAIDIDLPGQGGLPVRIERNFQIDTADPTERRGGFGLWDLDVPYIHGVFTDDWNTYGGGHKRCTQFGIPLNAGVFDAKDFWSGTKLHLPGSGDHDILRISNSNGLYPRTYAPADGRSYELGTKEFHRIRCKSTTANGYPGEAFVVVDASGVTYTLDVGMHHGGGSVTKYANDHGTAMQGRTHVYLMVSRVEDRFGNWVNYQWSGNRLTSITANDGRAITLAWSGRNILSATANERVWSYNYGNYGDLDRVTLPDGSFWRYQSSGVASSSYISPDISITGPDCLEAPDGNGVYDMAITHPSGAVGRFEFALIRHRRSGIPKSACQPYASNSGLAGYDSYYLYAMAIPDYFDVFSLVKKTLSGPGMSPQVWGYGYEIVYESRTPLQVGEAYPCLPINCHDAKSVSVIQPDGTEEEHRFGVIWHRNDGRLLAKYIRKPMPDRRVVRAEFYDYMSAADAATAAFPEVYGFSMSADDSLAIKIRPVIKTTVLQDGEIAPPVYWTPAPPPPPPPPCPDCPPPPPPVCDPVTGTCQAPTAITVPSLDFLNSNRGDVQAQEAQPVFSMGKSSSTTQFVSEVGVFDAFVRPVSVTQSNSLGYSKTDITEYHDDMAKWVIGQVKRQYIPNSNVNADPNSAGAVVVSQTEFNSQALPWRIYKFGKLQQTLTYNTNGTLATVTDGRNNTITLSDWKRGIPQLIQHPATPESPGGATESALVDNNGWIRSTTDENGYTHGYGYDAMGRMAGIVYPANDQVDWLPKTFEFRAMTANDWLPPGISVGQWRHYQVQGNHAKATYFDAMWRPVLTHEYDTTNINPTLRSTRFGYDANGRQNFQSYPTSDLLPPALGSRTFYDALGRVERTEQDSEQSVLTTKTEYLSGLQTRVTNPRDQKTTTGFMAWGQPGYDLPLWSSQPEGKIIEIARHPQFGWPLQLRQRSADNSVQASRQYVYDGNAQLCKTIEPETGASVMGYDAAGNLEWQVSGLPASSFSSTTDCQHTAAAGTGLSVMRTYDARNRLVHLAFPGGLGNQIWTYEKDNLPASVTAYNGIGHTDPVVTAYTYNKRRLLTGESLSQPSYTWGIGYEYDNIGNLRWQSYPTGLKLDFAPNALGQATQAQNANQSSIYYASGAQYFPNGALKQFTYGNGIVHSMSQNARQLPARVTSSGNVLDFGYDYDKNGNPTTILDLVTGTPTAQHRWMTYDGLDRLTTSASAMYGGSDHTHRFTYDALDNIESWKHAGVKDYADYVYDAQNRLTNIRNTAGATVVGIDYDPQGNLSNKNGQLYQFDYGNRLRNVTGKEWYRYDGLGRRVQTTKTDGSQTTLWQYGQAGQMLFSSDWDGPNNLNQKTHESIYLAGSLIATIDHAWPSNAVIATKYQHTDALGSPVALTNEAGAVIERNNYEPYGAIIGNPTRSGIGYTGHVMDGGTGLTYMQQRYYDQSIGRFLSIDPVTANSGTGANFNRYWYANNSPYRFVDPDGRQSLEQNTPSTRTRIPLWDRLMASSDAQGSRGQTIGKQLVFENSQPKSLRDVVLYVAIAISAGTGGSAGGSVGSTAGKEFKSFLTAANKPYNSTGLSVAARKLEQHATRPGGSFTAPTGTVAQKNDAASSTMQGILSNPDTVRTALSRGGTEFRTPNGQGVRFDADGSFNTFLDPKR